jgi:hypothetical protein
MLHIKRIDNNIKYKLQLPQKLHSNKTNEQQSQANTLLVPKIPSSRIAQETWYNMYEKEIEYIVNAYMSGISAFQSDKYIIRLNTEKFKNDLVNWIYKSSSNARKRNFLS